MKPGKKPDPMKWLNARTLRYDAQVRKWTQRLLADPEARPTDLNEEQLAFIYEEVARLRGERLEVTLFEKAMIATTPAIGSPGRTDLIEDLRHIWRQPEMIKFWRSWTLPRSGRGRAPNYPAAKAVLVVVGMGGISAHVDTVYEMLKTNAELRKVFAELEGKDDLQLPAYSSICRLIPLLAKSCRVAAIEQNLAMVKELKKLHPKAGIGKRIVMDGFAVAAWAQQHGAGAKDDAAKERREERLRERTPHAGFRAYVYTGAGKKPLEPGTLIAGIRVGRAKAWRGYSFGFQVDQAANVPLVWSMRDAAEDAAWMVIPMLATLHHYWPDINTEFLAADSEWDESPWCRLCEVDYGIAPIFRQKRSEARKAVIPLEEGCSRGGNVTAITRGGQLVCAGHGKPLDYDTCDIPSRHGLLPGQSTDERKFRIRARCTHSTSRNLRPCGRPGLQMLNSWHRLTRYPHHSNGDPCRYATRQALLARLNQAESFVNRLKAGLLLGLQGAGRTRLLDKDTVEALLSLGCISITSLTLADQRIQHDIDVDQLVYGQLIHTAHPAARPSTPDDDLVKAA